MLARTRSISNHIEGAAHTFPTYNLAPRWHDLRRKCGESLENLWRIFGESLEKRNDLNVFIAGRSLVVKIVTRTYLDRSSFAQNDHVLEIYISI